MYKITYIWAYLLKNDNFGVDSYQTKCHKYVYDILKLFGSQGQRSRPFYGSGKIEKDIKCGSPGEMTMHCS